jgi:hypothetical protein
MSVQRRDLLRLAAVVPVAAWLGTRRAAAAPLWRLFVYEPRIPASVWQALAARQGLAAGSLRLEPLPADLDRVRFARACVAAAPGWIGGVLRPVDLLVLAGTAEEEGYRMWEERMLRGSQAGLVVFAMQHRRRITI